MKEKWKYIKGFENLYQISNFGRIKSMYSNELILKFRLSSTGYFRVYLYKNKIAKDFYVHRLVGKAFVKGYKKGLEINHKDFNKLNNFYKNLEWLTKNKNILYSKFNNLKGEQVHTSKLTNKQVIKIRKLKGKFTQKEIGKMFNVRENSILNIFKNRTWKHL